MGVGAYSEHGPGIQPTDRRVLRAVVGKTLVVLVTGRSAPDPVPVDANIELVIFVGIGERDAREPDDLVAKIEHDHFIAPRPIHGVFVGHTLFREDARMRTDATMMAAPAPGECIVTVKEFSVIVELVR